MANLISWGVVYCSTWFGQVDETTLSIQNESAPPCFAPANEIVDQFVDSCRGRRRRCRGLRLLGCCFAGLG
jgi:hypothetical protein